MYNWHVISEGENHGGVCPEGFHVPSKEEWVIMFDYINNGSHMIADKLKEAGMVHWCGCVPWPGVGDSNAFPGENVWCHEGENSSQGCENYGFLSGPDNADGNTTGFTALPAGMRQDVSYENGPWVSKYIREKAFFWTSTEYSEDTTKAYSQTLKFDNISVNDGNNFTSFPDVHDSKGHGFSIRCIAD